MRFAKYSKLAAYCCCFCLIQTFLPLQKFKLPEVEWSIKKAVSNQRRKSSTDKEAAMLK